MIPLVPVVVAALRRAQPLHAGDDQPAFRWNGVAVDQNNLRGRRFLPALRALGIRPRKLYATRHTFISLALTDGVNIKWLAEYCGTSVARIEASYGRWMGTPADQLSRLESATPPGRFSVERSKLAK
jgi:integrase